MSDKKIRVLIVDDSALMRRIIQSILEQDPDISVVGSAKDGLEALKKAKDLLPDIITLDVEMPVMDGISCLENLQRQGSYGIIMVSSFTQEGANATIKALELGAFDFISKPENVFHMSADEKKLEIIEKVKLACRTSKKAPTLTSIEKKIRPGAPEQVSKASDLKYIIAVGISTGGPRALSSILPEFPGDLPASIVVVQHMPPGFTRSLATRLNETCQMAVKEAEDNEELKAGTIYIAPGDNHTTFQSEGRATRIRLTKTPPTNGFRPSADVMMTSLAESQAQNIIGVIMTGMGNDGSKGLKELKTRKNAYVVAQDESTSIVYGMPRSAIELGVVDKTVPLQEIPTCIMNFMGVRR
ncbi:MAG: chemotaxis response regulator protein-glutamate methylesterase [Clostridia bacterium]|nr:chemotaxis response regulator protein-glutamate methylesterase [Clostridia bacterium]